MEFPSQDSESSNSSKKNIAAGAAGPRKKNLEIKRIEETSKRQVTFCKRRNGLLKKAYELSMLCDAEVALVIFSNTGKLFEFSNISVSETIERYKKETCDSPDVTSSEAKIKYYEQESAKLRRLIQKTQDENMKMLGEGVDHMVVRDQKKYVDHMLMRDHKKYEEILEMAIGKIRARKNELLSAEIESMHKREVELHHANMRLRTKIAEGEKAQQMSLMQPDGGSEYQHPPVGSHPYDDQEFISIMTLMEPNQKSSHDRDQTCF